MPIQRAVCPGCGAGMRCADPAGFSVGEKIDCPKCGKTFAVGAAPAAKAVKPKVVDDEPPRKKAVKAAAAVDDDDDDDDRPRKKSRPRPVDDEDEDDDEDDDDRPRKKRKKGAKEKSYKNSPTRFIVLGVLVIIMLVLAFFLYQKFQREKENSQLPVPITTRA